MRIRILHRSFFFFEWGLSGVQRFLRVSYPFLPIAVEKASNLFFSFVSFNKLNWITNRSNQVSGDLLSPSHCHDTSHPIKFCSEDGSLLISIYRTTVQKCCIMISLFLIVDNVVHSEICHILINLLY